MRFRSFRSDAEDSAARTEIAQTDQTRGRPPPIGGGARCVSRPTNPLGKTPGDTMDRGSFICLPVIAAFGLILSASHGLAQSAKDLVGTWRLVIANNYGATPTKKTRWYPTAIFPCRVPECPHIFATCCG